MILLEGLVPPATMFASDVQWQVLTSSILENMACFSCIFLFCQSAVLGLRPSLQEFIIQEDNGKPHKAYIRDAFAEAAASNGWNISVTTQPPNSLDSNVLLDLGFFNSIQESLQYKKWSKDIDHLIANVEEAYSSRKECKCEETLKNVFLSLLQTCMGGASLVDGNNN